MGKSRVDIQDELKALVESFVGKNKIREIKESYRVFSLVGLYRVFGVGFERQIGQMKIEKVCRICMADLECGDEYSTKSGFHRKTSAILIADGFSWSFRNSGSELVGLVRLYAAIVLVCVLYDMLEHN